MRATSYDRNRNPRSGTTERDNPKPFSVTSRQEMDKVINPNSDARIDAKLKFISSTRLRRGQHVGFFEKVFDKETGKEIIKEVFYKVAMIRRGLTGSVYTCEEV